MTEPVLARHFTIGAREVYEDRVEVAQLETAGGLQLAVALVADGVGGEAMGERASQITIDSILSYLRAGTEIDVPRLLSGALTYANQQVFSIALAEGRTGMCSTASLAVLLGETLFVAAVGDSPIYFCRAGKLSRLTVGHTVATQLVWTRQMDVRQAEKDPRAKVVTDAIGLRETVQVDVGFYVGTMEFQLANERGRRGLPLLPGDSVLVCSDGLIKTSPTTGRPFVRDDEIVTVLDSTIGEEAARTLIAFALGRDPDDNVSVALIQLPGKGGGVRRAGGRRALWAMAAVAAVLLTALVYALLQIRTLTEQAAGLSESVARAEQTAQAPTATLVPSATFIPLATAVPARVPQLLQSGTSSDVAWDEPIDTRQTAAALFLPARDRQAGEAYVVLGPSTSFVLTALDGGRALISLLPGGRALVLSAGLERGVSLRLEPSSGLVRSQDGCLTVSSSGDPPSGWEIACWGGACEMRRAVGQEAQLIGAGDILSIVGAAALEATPVPASPSLADAWRALSADLPGEVATRLEACLGPSPVTPIPGTTSTP
jgi:protein phosphatase